MLNDVPEFVGPDLNVYGPYKAGETQELPQMVAGMLISTGQAKDEITKENFMLSVFPLRVYRAFCLQSRGDRLHP